MDAERTSSLVERMLSGDRVALARLMTLAENRAGGLTTVMSRLHARTGRAHVVGITGPPGAGKSTLADRLLAHLRAADARVGVVAVDPSSPFSGGAVLGDRIRMQAHFLDPQVFIRSLSTRGSHGGLPRAARDVVRLLDAFGVDVVLVETVGVGQTELDVMRLADTIIVVLVPEAGDAVQVMKAGLLEIADVFVVNKADRDGAMRMVTDLQQMLHVRQAGPWDVPVLATEASRDVGIDAVLDAVRRHRQAAAADPERQRRAAARRLDEVVDLVGEELSRRLAARLARGDGNTAALTHAVADGSVDPYAAALRLLDDADTLTALVGEGR